MSSFRFLSQIFAHTNIFIPASHIISSVINTKHFLFLFPFYGIIIPSYVTIIKAIASEFLFCSYAPSLVHATFVSKEELIVQLHTHKGATFKIKRVKN